MFLFQIMKNPSNNILHKILFVFCIFDTQNNKFLDFKWNISIWSYQGSYLQQWIPSILCWIVNVAVSCLNFLKSFDIYFTRIYIFYSNTTNWSSFCCQKKNKEIEYTQKHLKNSTNESFLFVVVETKKKVKHHDYYS